MRLSRAIAPLFCAVYWVHWVVDPEVEGCFLFGGSPSAQPLSCHLICGSRVVGERWWGGT